MGKRIVFTGKQQVICENFDPPAPGPGEIRVKALVTLMSTGTENIVFNRNFDPGTHWDNWVKYPFYPGYSMLGEVEAVGKDLKNFKPGDRVATRAGHTSHANLPEVVVRNVGTYDVVPEAGCYPAPKDLDPRQAVWFSLAKICAIGAKAAQFTLGDRVLVVGAGPIGQMTVRWARAAGAEAVVVVDMVASRLEMAKRGGATAVIAKPISEAAEQIKAATFGRGPRVAIDSTGNKDVFAQVLGVVPDFARVVILGDTGAPAQQHLTLDVITRGLTIVGAHDRHVTPEWNSVGIIRLFYNLVQAGRFNVEGLVTHTFKPEECAKAYETANTKRGETMGIMFDWR